ncbi:MAG TPA: antibiotic biosynthesis monooxygenase family protein [Rhodothermales bacterium]|nr:antibiotic biosynthesis monooxygenase family protein [Rhodothermales bacterium]
MLVRIVQMHFRPDAVDTFLDLFYRTAPQIRAFEGCRHLELWQDTSDPTRLTTYSHWQGADALDAYRRSDLFRTTWAETKALFQSPAEAASYGPVWPA